MRNPAPRAQGEATPALALPWTATYEDRPFARAAYIKDADGDGIAEANWDHAAHIVRCVNAHDALLAFVEEIVPFLHNVEHVERARALLARAQPRERSGT